MDAEETRDTHNLYIERTHGNLKNIIKCNNWIRYKVANAFLLKTFLLEKLIDAYIRDKMLMQNLLYFNQHLADYSEEMALHLVVVIIEEEIQ